MANDKSGALALFGQLIAAALAEAGAEAGFDAGGPRMLPIKDAAKYLGIGTTKFRELEAAGEIPKRVPIAGQPRWDRKELDRYIERQRRASKTNKK